MLTVTKRFEFCYGHRLRDYCGPCRRMHGHNSVAEFTFTPLPPPWGKEPSYPTMVVDFRDLKVSIGPIVDLLDHQDLTNFFRGDDWMEYHFGEAGEAGKVVPPTAETICVWLAKKVFDAEDDIGAKLLRVRVSETPDSWAEWDREEG
jgi:6-pyruvoyltetrahydropterin/6-carboxytetrahydropterin synthase